MTFKPDQKSKLDQSTKLDQNKFDQHKKAPTGQGQQQGQQQRGQTQGQSTKINQKGTTERGR